MLILHVRQKVKMIESEAQFILEAETLAVFVREGLEEGKNEEMFFGHGELILSNLESWINLMQTKKIYDLYSDAGFGLSKSDLQFGNAEKKLYELERSYRKLRDERAQP